MKSSSFLEWLRFMLTPIKYPLSLYLVCKKKFILNCETVMYKHSYFMK